MINSVIAAKLPNLISNIRYFPCDSATSICSCPRTNSSPAKAWSSSSSKGQSSRYSKPPPNTTELTGAASMIADYLYCVTLPIQIVYNYTIQMKLKLTLITILILQTAATSYSYSSCSSSTYINTANLQCTACPSNQIANTYQTVASACQCSIGYAASANGACTAITPSCSYSSNSFTAMYGLNGDVGTNTCASCALTAYTNRYPPLNSATALAVPPAAKTKLTVVHKVALAAHHRSWPLI